jgi:hypothetical protein
MLAGRMKAPRRSVFPEDGMLKNPVTRLALHSARLTEDHTTVDGLVKDR